MRHGGLPAIRARNLNIKSWLLFWYCYGFLICPWTSYMFLGSKKNISGIFPLWNTKLAFSGINHLIRYMNFIDTGWRCLALCLYISERFYFFHRGGNFSLNQREKHILAFYSQATVTLLTVQASREPCKCKYFHIDPLPIYPTFQ